MVSGMLRGLHMYLTTACLPVKDHAVPACRHSLCPSFVLSDVHNDTDQMESLACTVGRLNLGKEAAASVSLGETPVWR